MNFRYFIFIFLLILNSQAGAQKTAVEYNLSLKAGQQYYDQDFYGKVELRSEDHNSDQTHAAWSKYMFELNSFMMARKMRLDNLTNQSIYNPEVLRKVDFGTTEKTEYEAAREIYEKGRAYQAFEFSGDTHMFRPLEVSDVFYLMTLNRSFVYVVDHRVRNYFDISDEAYDWFNAIERAYDYERVVSASYDSMTSNRMKSLIGFKRLSNFLGALIWTKALQSSAYKASLTKALHDKSYWDRLMGVVTGDVAGSEMEKVVSRDLVALVTSKTGKIAELDRINIVSYPASKVPPVQLKLREKTLELFNWDKNRAAAAVPSKIKSCKYL